VRKSNYRQAGMRGVKAGTIMFVIPGIIPYKSGWIKMIKKAMLFLSI
jgi:hypothetical protein